MSDQTPRMPELWFSPSEKALWEKDEDGYFCPDYYPIRSATELPADAVKLGDVEGLRAAVLAVLDSFDPNDWSTPTFAFEARRNFARIRAIVEGETR